MAAFQSTPWAILPEKLAEIRSFLRLKADGGDVEPEQIAEIARARLIPGVDLDIGTLKAEFAKQNMGPKAIDAVVASRRSDGVQMIGRVAVLPVMGVISQRVSMLEKASGGVSTEEIGASLDSLVADKQVKTIVMAFDSPGGSVSGVPELAAKIRAARDQKKIIALADPMAASAAYWLASQASEFVVTPSGQVGSVGVIAAHDDLTAALEQAGIKTTLITSAPHKAELYPENALSEEAKADMQAKVNQYHGMFVADIAKGRGITENSVSKNFGGGRMLLAKDALAAGMVDRIATAEQLFGKLAAADGVKADSNARQIRARMVELAEAGL